MWLCDGVRGVVTDDVMYVVTDVGRDHLDDV